MEARDGNQADKMEVESEMVESKGRDVGRER